MGSIKLDVLSDAKYDHKVEKEVAICNVDIESHAYNNINLLANAPLIKLYTPIS